MKVSSSGRSLKAFADFLRRLPRDVARDIASEAAPALTSELQRSYAARQTPDGDAWAGDYDLYETGKLKGVARFRAEGTRIRCDLGSVEYAQYHANDILPRRAGRLPRAWQRALEDAARDVLKRRADAV